MNHQKCDMVQHYKKRKQARHDCCHFDIIRKLRWLRFPFLPHIQAWNRYFNYCRMWLCAQVVNRPVFLLWAELGQMDCEASRCAACSRVVWSGWLTSAGWKEGSREKKENALALLWLSGSLTIFLSNQALGGCMLIHLTMNVCLNWVKICLSFIQTFHVSGRPNLKSPRIQDT